MARRFILEVRRAPYSPKAPYLVHVPKSLHAAEGAQRRFFEKEAIARAYVKRLAKMLGEYQLQALGLNDVPGLLLLKRPASGGDQRVASVEVCRDWHFRNRRACSHRKTFAPPP